MRFTIIGGDLRSVHLCHRLLKDGHEVRCFGLDRGDIPLHCKEESLEAALGNTECVVLPIPAFSGSLLRAPYSACSLSADIVARVIPKDVPIFGGGSRPIPMADLTAVETMAIGNAALTVQGALLLLLQNTDRALAGQQVLILGGGRIGTLLGLKLKDLDAQVIVASRRSDCRAWHTAMGMKAVDMDCLRDILPTADMVVNTVPAPILDSAALQLLQPRGILLELASLPGGFDPMQAEALELRPIIGRGLPGTYTPAAAADLIAETIYHELEL